MLTIDLKRSPKLYTVTAPAGAELIGVVERDNGEAGALARISATGLYVQVNAGVLRSLPQRQVRDALATAMADPASVAAMLGRRGGSSTTEAKREASRRNGSRGGRPKRG